MKDTITKAYTIKHLFDNTVTNPVSGCWEWRGSKTRDGYGQLSNHRIFERYGIKGVHRLAKVLLDDWQPTTRHEQIRHRCGNRACWNVHHTLTGTALENAADKIVDGTMPKGETHHSAKLTDDQVRALRADRESGMKLRELADRYSISIQYVSRIMSRKSRGDA